MAWMKPPPGALLMMLAGLAGCASPPPDQAPFPDQIDGFTRVAGSGAGWDSASGPGTRAAYAMQDASGAYVTVWFHAKLRSASLLPGLDITQPSVNLTMAQAAARLKRFYPAATAAAPEGFSLMEYGGLQTALRQRFRYAADPTDASSQTETEIVEVCCTGKGNLAEYWFRHPAAQNIDLSITAFLRDLPWPDEGS